LPGWHEYVVEIILDRLELHAFNRKVGGNFGEDRGIREILSVFGREIAEPGVVIPGESDAI